MEIQNLNGNQWSARKIGNDYIVSLRNGAKIFETLTDFAVSQGLSSGQISGVGAVNSVTLGFYDMETKDYVQKTFKEQMEVTNIGGNISRVEGKTLLHLHITLGRQDYSALAGHMKEAIIHGAGEFFVRSYPVPAIKVKDETSGINFYDFEK